MSGTEAYGVRISGGVVVLTPVEPPFGWGDLAAFQRDVGVVSRLAESAPDLLAACEHALAHLHNFKPDTDDSKGCQIYEGARIMLRAAIAKARGQ